LVWHRLPSWVQKSQTVRDELEDEGVSVLGNGLVGEHLEDLLKGGLTHTVLLDSKVKLVLFDVSKQPSNSLILLWHSELVEVSALLQHLHLLEDTTKESNDTETDSLGVQEGHQVNDTHLTIWVKVSLKDKVFANTVSTDLVKNDGVELLSSACFNGFIKLDLIL